MYCPAHKPAVRARNGPPPFCPDIHGSKTGRFNNFVIRFFNSGSKVFIVYSFLFRFVWDAYAAAKINKFDPYAGIVFYLGSKLKEHPRCLNMIRNRKFV